MIQRTLLALTIGLALAGTGSAFGEVKVPSTTQEHAVLAQQYQQKADSARKEAAEHRQMAEGYKNSVANASEKRGERNPWIAEMEKHCEALVLTADKLANENQKAADYHTLRGKELQGK